MNPRIFCREGRYQKTLLLTYSFDPLFFERVVLPDLWAGQSSDILVIGDRGQIDGAIESCSEHLSNLGRKYQLGSVDLRGAYHPKLMLRLSAEEGLVWIGSGNVTSSGWGGNQELAAAWKVGPKHNDAGGWINGLLKDVDGWCSNDLEREAIRRMQDLPWLFDSSGVSANSAVLYSHQALTLSSAFKERWAGRRFDSMKILTGSTDQSGAFLRWAHDTFGIKTADIVLSPSRASFDPKQLADLPLELRLIPAPAHAPLHAKHYWFEGPDGAAAIMGSANCSAAAWLLAPGHGGNVEAVVVYDNATREGFADVLSLFEAPAFEAEELLPEPAESNENEEQEVSAADYRLLSLQWDQATLLVTAMISPSPSSDATVELLISRKTISLNKTENVDGNWYAHFEEIPKGTTLGRVRIAAGEDICETSSRWIDDVQAIRQASQTVRAIEPFRALNCAATSSEQQQMLQSLQQLSRSLFHDPSAFYEPSAPNMGETATIQPKVEISTEVKAVDPNDLVCHLGEGNVNAPGMSSGRGGSFALNGIMRLLFSSSDDEEPDIAVIEEPSCDGDDNDQKSSPRNGAGYASRHQATPQVISPRLLAQFDKQMAEFMGEIGKAEFAEKCTATQMVNAAVFPLAIALMGAKKGWVSPEKSVHWGRQIIAILFQKPSKNESCLLKRVEERYRLNNKVEIFNNVVGDGPLWLILISTVGNCHWEGPENHLDKALALREVFRSNELVRAVRPEQINSMLRTILIQDARRWISEIAPKISQILDAIEVRLLPIQRETAAVQAERRLIIGCGDLLWNEKGGWAVGLPGNQTGFMIDVPVRLNGKETTIRQGYFVNVTELAKQDNVLREHLQKLRSLLEP